MAGKPAIVTVDDDPEVLRAVERDLRRRYGERYRVVRAPSGAAALDAVERLVARGDAVALLVADQRMPEMTGVEFLERAAAHAPDARRVLLTAYADTDAAIRAINRARIHHYLTKPWDPPEEHLYPALDDLLADWQASYRPEFDGVRVIGLRWAPRSHALRDFLGRNLIPFRWLDVDTVPEARTQLARALPDVAHPRMPVVVLPDGPALEDPEVRDVAERLGLRTQAERPYYDLVVVGGGPAGLAAAVYGASEGLHTLLVEREAPGGQAGTSSRIENYLGFPVGLSGADLTRRAVAQARRFGAELLTPQEVTGVRVEDAFRVLTFADGREVSARVLLVATGVSYRTLDVPGADRLTGAGIYYGAAMTEALSCQDQAVHVIGAGNSAGQAAMHLAQYARSVSILVRGDGLAATMSQYLVDQIRDTPNITVETRTQLIAAHGDDHLERITVRCADGEAQERETTSVFVFIGAQPRTDWLGDVVRRDRHGFILTGAELLADGGRPAGWPLARDPWLLETSVPGIFAAGDVRHQSVKRVASAVGEGSISVQFTHRYLAET